MLPRVRPMDLLRLGVPLDDPDFIFEIKFDGFRAWPTSARRCKLVSRKGHAYKRFAGLIRWHPRALALSRAPNAGSWVTLEPSSRS